ncbi:MAG: type II toxin-antitoxin system mRNA interferase toxin, RelE/StbE family [Minisyncoccia bacterium]
MEFDRHPIFKRQWQKLSQKLQAKTQDRLLLLSLNEYNEVLNNHKLHPPFDAYRSINITGDLRLVYRRTDSRTLYLRAIGTHHQLYGT